MGTKEDKGRNERKKNRGWQNMKIMRESEKRGRSEQREKGKEDRDGALMLRRKE
jgi:hypothetical protein